MVTIRKMALVVDEIYHIFNRSIAEYKIFNDEKSFLRMKELFKYYQWEEDKPRFSKSESIENSKNVARQKEKLVDIIAYCIMPTHIHLILKQLKDKGISIFMSQISNSYAKYFNLKHKRKGPLWEGSFRNVLVSTSEQLLHLTRYIHLNPVTAFLVEKPEDWVFSSYREFLGEVNDEEKICNFKEVLEIDPISYKKFVEERISYQRDLAKIKDLVLN